MSPHIKHFERFRDRKLSLLWAPECIQPTASPPPAPTTPAPPTASCSPCSPERSHDLSSVRVVRRQRSCRAHRRPEYLVDKSIETVDHAIGRRRAFGNDLARQRLMSFVSNVIYRAEVPIAVILATLVRPSAILPRILPHVRAGLHRARKGAPSHHSRGFRPRTCLSRRIDCRGQGRLVLWPTLTASC